MTDTLAERLATRPPSVGAMLLDRVRASGPDEAFRYLDGSRWVSLTWSQTKDKVFELAAGLLALGLQREERVAIASGTRIEWILADLGIMCAGGATTTVYPTTQHEDVAFIIGDSDSRAVFAEDASQVAKLLEHIDELPELIQIVQLDGKVDHPKVVDWNEFLAAGREHLTANPSCVDDAIAALEPEHLATLIYTSGTTGRPKGVRLVQDCWTYEGISIEEFDILTPDDLQYLWLPLSHVFGKALIAVQLRIGFATAVDGQIDKIVDNLAAVNPTFMAGAPRIFEKVRARVMMSTSGGVKGKIFGLGVRGRPEDDADAAAGREAGRGARRPAGARRQARVQQDQGADGRPDPVLRLRLGRPEPRGPGVVLRGRPARAGGIRADRDQRRDVRQQPARDPVRHRRPGRTGDRGQDRRRRRDPGQGSGCDARLPQSGRGDRAPRSTTTGSSTPATSASSTRTATCGSPTARRT